MRKILALSTADESMLFESLCEACEKVYNSGDNRSLIIFYYMVKLSPYADRVKDRYPRLLQRVRAAERATKEQLLTFYSILKENPDRRVRVMDDLSDCAVNSSQSGIEIAFFKHELGSFLMPSLGAGLRKKLESAGLNMDCLSRSIRGIRGYLAHCDGPENDEAVSDVVLLNYRLWLLSLYFVVFIRDLSTFGPTAISRLEQMPWALSPPATGSQSPERKKNQQLLGYVRHALSLMEQLSEQLVQHGCLQLNNAPSVVDGFILAISPQDKFSSGSYSDFLRNLGLHFLSLLVSGANDEEKAIIYNEATPLIMGLQTSHPELRWCFIYQCIQVFEELNKKGSRYSGNMLMMLEQLLPDSDQVFLEMIETRCDTRSVFLQEEISIIVNWRIHYCRYCLEDENRAKALERQWHQTILPRLKNSNPFPKRHKPPKKGRPSPPTLEAIRARQQAANARQLQPVSSGPPPPSPPRRRNVAAAAAAASAPPPFFDVTAEDGSEVERRKAEKKIKKAAAKAIKRQGDKARCKKEKTTKKRL